MSWLENYKRDGVVVLRNAISGVCLDNIMREWESLFHHQIKRHKLSKESFEANLFELFRKDITAFKNSGKLCYGLQSLFVLAGHNDLYRLARMAGVKHPVHNTRPVILVNSNNTALHGDYARYPAHQDWRGSQGSLNSVVIWCCLKDIRQEHGPLEFIKGSHRWGLLDADDANYVTVPQIKQDISEDQWESAGPMQVGDVVLFSTFLVHRSGKIDGDNVRWSVSFRYTDIGEEDYINRGFVEPYAYRGSERLITEGYPSKEQVNEAFDKL